MRTIFRVFSFILSILFVSSSTHAFFPLQIRLQEQEETPGISAIEKRHAVYRHADSYAVFKRTFSREDLENLAKNPNSPLEERDFEAQKVSFCFKEFGPLEMDFIISLRGEWRTEITYDHQILTPEGRPLSREEILDFYRLNQEKLVLNGSQILQRDTQEVLGTLRPLQAPGKYLFASRTPSIFIESSTISPEERNAQLALAKLTYMNVRSFGYGMHEENYEEALASLQDTASLKEHLPQEYLNDSLPGSTTNPWKDYLFFNTQFHTLKILQLLAQPPSPTLKIDLNKALDGVIKTLEEAQSHISKKGEDPHQRYEKLLLAYHILKTSLCTEEEKSSHMIQIDSIFSALKDQDKYLPFAHPDLKTRFSYMSSFLASTIPLNLSEHKLFKDIPLGEDMTSSLASLPEKDRQALTRQMKVSSLFLRNIELFSH